MKTANEKNKRSDVRNGIKEERLKALKGNYQSPEISQIKLNNKMKNNCSDMASCCCVVIKY